MSSGSGRVVDDLCRADRRFPFTLWLPSTLGPDTRLLMAVHGSDRDHGWCRDFFTDFGRAHDVAVLAPLFGVGVGGDDEGAGYKFLHHTMFLDHTVFLDHAETPARTGGGDRIHVDRVMLSMVAEVGSSYGIDVRRFGLVGFSGGGQCVHRFALLHAERLWGLSVGAPGTVTLLDDSLPYWAGTAGVTEILGAPVDLDALRRLPVHLVIGADDLDDGLPVRRPGDATWVEGADTAGVTRRDRIESLRRSWSDARISVALDVVPEAGHEPGPCWERSLPYLAERLAAHRTDSER